MASAPLYHTDRVRAALDAIRSDPEHGPSALGRPHELANLLSDYLPGCPKEAGILIAAASAGMPGTLQNLAAQGIDPGTVQHFAAASFAERTAFTPDACQWVTAELARALGITMLSAPSLPPTGSTEVLTQRMPMSQFQTSWPAGGRRRASGISRALRDRVVRLRLTAVATALVLAAGAILVALAHHDRVATSAPNIPAPELARLIPASQRVLRIYYVNLDPPLPKQVAVTTTTSSPATPNDSGFRGLGSDGRFSFR
jgi:hypothetical protein